MVADVEPATHGAVVDASEQAPADVLGLLRVVFAETREAATHVVELVVWQVADVAPERIARQLGPKGWWAV